MAGKGGGSWKVAYADFVTAMMAFFLVMWIGAQDQKTRQSVASYFSTPMAGSSKPVPSGGDPVVEARGHAPTPATPDSNPGRESFSHTGEPSTPTAKVNVWIRSDPNRLKQWQERAQQCREEAQRFASKVKGVDPDNHARGLLEKELRLELATGAVSQSKEVYTDLLLGTLREVNYQELAGDLLGGR